MAIWLKKSRQQLEAIWASFRSNVKRYHDDEKFIVLLNSNFKCYKILVQPILLCRMS